MKTDVRKKILTTTFPSVLLQILSAWQFILIQQTLAKGDTFYWQFFIFLGVSILFSLYLPFLGKGLPIVLIIRFFIIFLIGYPLQENLTVEMTLMVSLLLETGMFLSLPWNLPVMVVSDMGYLFFQKPLNAFHLDLPGPEKQDFLVYIIVTLTFIFLLYSLSAVLNESREKNEIIKRLDIAISRLGKANLGFQDMTTSLELDTLKKERNRVSREIHDTVGYSLTNVRIMLEAASLMLDNDREKAKDLIRKSMEEAGICLEETRTAMRQLRSKEVERPRGLKAFFKLVNVFAEATGVTVKLEFGNVPDSFTPGIDKAVFRFIQEGLTNSFRHGRATEIRIYFWIEQSILKVSLQDNGLGADTLTEGIGLTGMKERLQDLKGWMNWKNLSDGFEISLCIPLERTEK